MHRLDTDFALPHALEPALLLRAGVGALPSAAALGAKLLLKGALVLAASKGLAGLCVEGALAEEGPRGAEEACCGCHGCEKGDGCWLAKRLSVWFCFMQSRSEEHTSELQSHS